MKKCAPTWTSPPVPPPSSSQGQSQIGKHLPAYSTHIPEANASCSPMPWVWSICPSTLTVAEFQGSRKNSSWRNEKPATVSNTGSKHTKSMCCILLVCCCICFEEQLAWFCSCRLKISETWACTENHAYTGVCIGEFSYRNEARGKVEFPFC